MIHNRTMWALCLALVGGYVGGMVGGPHGLIVAAAAGSVSIYVAPHADRVAVEWRAHGEDQQPEDQ